MGRAPSSASQKLSTKPPRLPLGGNSARKAPGGRLYIRVRYETGDARHFEASPRGEAVNEVD